MTDPQRDKSPKPISQSELITARATSSPGPQALKVLYIMGAPRCGSTILDNILNEIDGFFSVGELRFLFERLKQQRLCGCGRSFVECPVWGPVLAQVLGPLPDSSLEVDIRRQREISATWRTWQVLHQGTRQRISDKLRAHTESKARLYEAIGQTTGARVIVDSSKRPWDAALLPLMPGVSPFFLHLVRDPKAMAFSQSKVKTNPDRTQPSVIAATSVSRSASQWLRRNLAADAVRRRQRPGRSMLLGYRRFCSQPRQVVQEIVSFVGEDPISLPFSDDHTVVLGGNHSVSGNPDRFRTGPVTVREDDRWKRDMPLKDKVIAGGLTMPLMYYYARGSSDI